MERSDWILIGFISVFLLILFTKYFFSRNYNALKNEIKYDEVQENHLIFSLIYYGIFIYLIALNLSFYVQKPILFFIISDVFTNNVLVLFCILFLFLVVNYFVRKLFFLAFNAWQVYPKISRSWSYHITIFSQFFVGVSFVLFYVNSFQENLDYRLYILILMGVLFVILMIIQKIKEIKLTGNQYWYYNILYLCALEIFPIFLGYKLLHNFQLTH